MIETTSIPKKPTAFPSDLIPKDDDTYNLGSESKRWGVLYAVLAVLSSIVIGNVMLTSDIDGTLLINASTMINGSLNVTGNISGNTYFGDGSQLTGIVSGVAGLWDNGTDWISINEKYTQNMNVSDTLYVDGSSGEVGIGITTPAYTLDINKGGGGRGVALGIDYDILNPISTMRGGDILFTPSEQNGLGALINTNYWNSVSESRLTLQSYNNANQLVLHEGGNVGIGTTTPALKLVVVGDLNVTGNIHLNNNLDIFDGTVGIGTAASSTKLHVSGDITLGTGSGVPTLTFSGLNSNNTIFKPTTNTLATEARWRIADGTVSAPGISFTSDPDTGFFRISEDKMSVITGGDGTQGFVIDNVGNVGIGTTTAASKLVVVGDLNVTGNMNISGCISYNGGTLGTCI